MAFDDLHMEFCDLKVCSKRSETTLRPIKQF